MKMILFVLLDVLMIVFASDKNDFVENGTKSLGRMNANKAEQSIVTKIGDDEYAQKRGTSKYIGTIYKESRSQWEAHRWSENEKKLVYSGYYNDEETAAHASDTLARKLMANGEKGHKLNFPDDNTEIHTNKETTSVYIGVNYFKRDKVWGARRFGKNKKKMIYNGTYKDEETAAHASDTLARKLMTNGEQDHKLNFPDDHTEVHRNVNKANTTSNYIGVYYMEKNSMWRAQRWSKNDKRMVSNGSYKIEETAAHASDTLARKLIANGEQGHKLNFPDENTEVNTDEEATSPIYIGVCYQKKGKLWGAQRWGKYEKKMIQYGHYKDRERAAHASDTLARKLMANGEQNHKLNFPDDHTELHAKVIKKYIGVYYHENHSTWSASRRSKHEKKILYNGTYNSEETAAHASDTLARKLMANGEQDHKLNFPMDDIEVHSEKRTKYIGVHYNEKQAKWYAKRWSKKQNKIICNGYYNYERRAAHASDTLARKLMENGEEGHKLNFPEDDTDVYPKKAKHQKKRKRQDNSESSQSKKSYQIQI